MDCNKTFQGPSARRKACMGLPVDSVQCMRGEFKRRGGH